MPKIIPDKIKAQFQHEEDYRMDATLANSKVSGAQKFLGSSIVSADVFSPGLKSTYLSQKMTHVPHFERNLEKTEANIAPEVGGLIQIAQKKRKTKEEQAYEKQINTRFFADAEQAMGGIVSGEASTNGIVKEKAQPKVTFTSKEMFEEANKLCQ